MIKLIKKMILVGCASIMFMSSAVQNIYAKEDSGLAVNLRAFICICGGNTAVTDRTVGEWQFAYDKPCDHYHTEGYDTYYYRATTLVYTCQRCGQEKRVETDDEWKVECHGYDRIK